MEIFESITKIQVLGTACLFAGILIRYWIGRRRFNRRTPYGTTAYRSYEHKVFSVWENFARLGGGLLILAGVLLILLDWISKR